MTLNALIPRVPQRGFEPPPFLAPPGILRLGFPLDNLHLDPDGRGSLGMLPLGCFQGGLCPIDGPLATFALLLAGSLLGCPFTLAPLLLLFRRRERPFAQPFCRPDGRTSPYVLSSYERLSPGFRRPEDNFLL